MLGDKQMLEAATMLGDKQMIQAAESSTEAASLLRLVNLKPTTADQVLALAALVHELHAVTLTLEVIADAMRSVIDVDDTGEAISDVH